MPTGAPDSGLLNESSTEGNTSFFSPSSTIESPNKAKSPMQRLEINDLDEDASFLQSLHNYIDNVTDNSLFIEQSKTRQNRGADTSYTIERFTDLKELDSQWEDDEVDEIVVMSPKPTMLSPSQKQYSQGFCNTKQSPLSTPRLLCASPMQPTPNPKLTPTLTLTSASKRISVLTPNFHSSTSHPTFAEFTVLKQPPDTYTSLCQKRDSGRVYVLKTLSSGVEMEKMVLERIQGYIRATSQSNEEGADAVLATFLPVLHWTFREENKICLILDHYPNGTLYDLVKREGSLTAAKTLRLTTELTTALTVLSSLSIIHGSIYPSGIMIDVKGHVVLSEFGDAKLLDCEYCHSDDSMHGKDEEDGWREKKTYLAPEILLGWRYGQATDVWGLGMVMYFMLFGKHPFIANAQNGEQHDSAALDSTTIHHSIPADWLHLIHPVAKDLMLKCLERNPSLRLDIVAVRGHTYFAHVDWEEQLKRPAAMAQIAVEEPVCDVQEADEVSSPKNPSLASLASNYRHHLRRSRSFDPSVLQNLFNSQFHPEQPRPAATPAMFKRCHSRRDKKHTRIVDEQLHCDQPSLAESAISSIIARQTHQVLPAIFRSTSSHSGSSSSADCPPQAPSQRTQVQFADARHTSAHDFIDTKQSTELRDNNRLPTHEGRLDEVNSKERLARFWEMLDEEEDGCTTAVSEIHQLVPRPRKLQKRHLDALPTPQRRRLSAHSHSRDCEKMQNTPFTRALRSPGEYNLPEGIEQIGHGIGYTYEYHPPAATRSKASLRPAAPLFIVRESFHTLGAKMGCGHGKGRDEVIQELRLDKNLPEFGEMYKSDAPGDVLSASAYPNVLASSNIPATSTHMFTIPSEKPSESFDVLDIRFREMLAREGKGGDPDTTLRLVSPRHHLSFRSVRDQSGL